MPISEDICDFCLQGPSLTEASRILLRCTTCPAKAHPVCMDYSKDLGVKASSFAWQCFDCKSCTVCLGNDNGDSLLLCDSCDRAYHMLCLLPPLTQRPEGMWKCESCVFEQDGNQSVYSNETTVSYNSRTTSVRNSLPSDVIQCNSCQSLHPVNIPDAINWSVEQVASFIKACGFAKEASIFAEQEIDGRSLLLISRQDILCGLNLKLGPALKIYKQIQHLQVYGKPLDPLQKILPLS